MIERPTAWPDGRKLGGTNGYPPEWHQWARQCETRYVVKQMLAAHKESRHAVYTQWAQVFPHVTHEKVREAWDQVAKERRERTTRTA